MSTARPILIVDDDDALRSALMEHIAAHDAFQPHEAATLGEATQRLEAADIRFDAVVLDVNLPDGDGRDFCVQMRLQGYKMPVIMLTGRSDETDVVRGLDAGANDYLSKPFRSSELLARLNAQLRLFDDSVDAVFSIGSYTFRPSAKLLAKMDKNQRVRLTNVEVRILKFLHQAGNRVVSRQTLLDEVWGNAGATKHTLQTHIHRLRQKLEADPTSARLLITWPGGYQLNAAG